MSSLVEIYNMALAELGAEAILSTDEGSTNADLCNRFYPIVRDSVLRSHPWNCAIYRQDLSRLVAAPIFEYTYQYQLPSDPYCLRVLGIEDESEDTNYKIEGRYLLTDEDAVAIKYIGRVTDPNQFDSLLTEAIGLRLASRLALPVTGNRALAEMMEVLYRASLQEARTVDGMEGTIEKGEDDTLTKDR